MTHLKSKSKNLKQRMMQIKPHPTGYFRTCEGSIRFCHVEDGELKYLIFPVGDVKAMTTAAQLLIDCGIVDGWREVKFGESLSYIELFQYKFHKHIDAQGMAWVAMVKAVKQWSDLKLTQYDVRHFIARFEILHPELPVAQRKTPVIQMPLRQTISKRTA